MRQGEFDFNKQKNKQKMPKKGSQSWKVLNYLMEGNVITSFTAFYEFRITGLPQRIYDLKNIYGWDINDRQIVKRDEDGKLIKYNEYSLDEFADAV